MSAASQPITSFGASRSALPYLNSHLKTPHVLTRGPPDLWTKDDVHQWLLTCCAEWEVNIPMDKFIMNGRAMSVLTKKDFMDRSPEAGDLLYNTLHNYAISCSHFENYPDVRMTQMYPLTMYNVPASRDHYPVMDCCIDQRHHNEFEDISVSSSQPNVQLNASNTCPSSLISSSWQNGLDLKTLKSEGEVVVDIRAIPTPVQHISNESLHDIAVRKENIQNNIDTRVTRRLIKEEYLDTFSNDQSSTGDNISRDAVFAHTDVNTSEGTISTTQQDTPETKTASTSTSNNDGKLLWEFLKQLLDSGQYETYIKWVDTEVFSFRILNPSALAQLWGHQKNRENMTYEKLSRALRYYYKMNIISKVPGKRLTYKFLQKPSTIKRGQRGAKVGSMRGRSYKKTKENLTPKPPHPIRQVHSSDIPTVKDFESPDKKSDIYKRETHVLSIEESAYPHITLSSDNNEDQDVPMDLSVSSGIPNSASSNGHS